MQHSLLLCLLSLQLSCATATVKAARPVFVFQADSGLCLNAEGVEGLNAFDPKIVFAQIDPKGRKQIIKGRNVSCTDFRSVTFHKHIGVNYNILDSWDFRGSRFDGASLQFNFIRRGLFQGSNVDLLDIGYGRVSAADRILDKGDMPMPSDT